MTCIQCIKIVRICSCLPWKICVRWNVTINTGVHCYNYFWSLQRNSISTKHNAGINRRLGSDADMQMQNGKLAAQVCVLKNAGAAAIMQEPRYAPGISASIDLEHTSMQQKSWWRQKRPKTNRSSCPALPIIKTGCPQKTKGIIFPIRYRHDHIGVNTNLRQSAGVSTSLCGKVARKLPSEVTNQVLLGFTWKIAACVTGKCPSNAQMLWDFRGK